MKRINNRRRGRREKISRKREFREESEREEWEKLESEEPVAIEREWEDETTSFVDALDRSPFSHLTKSQTTSSIQSKVVKEINSGMENENGPREYHFDHPPASTYAAMLLCSIPFEIFRASCLCYALDFWLLLCAFSPSTWGSLVGAVLGDAATDLAPKTPRLSFHFATSAEQFTSEPSLFPMKRLGRADPAGPFLSRAFRWQQCSGPHDISSGQGMIINIQ